MPVGFRIASAWVDIRAEDKGLRQQIKGIVEKAAKGQDATIPLKIDSKGLRKEVQDALKAATKGQKPKVEIGIKSTGLRREVTDALKRATAKQKPSVKLSINSAGLRREVQAALNAATKGQKPTVRLGISSVGLRAEVQRALTAATAGQQGTVTVDIDVDSRRLRRALADANPTLTPNFDVKAMRQNLLSAIRRINVNDEVHINANIDGDFLARQIQSEVGRLRDKFRVRIHPDVDTDTFAAQIQRAARSVAGDIDIDLNPRINQLRLRAEAAKAFAALRGKIQFDGDLNTAMLVAQVKAAQAALNRLGRDLTFRAKVDVDTAQAMAKIAAMKAVLKEHSGHWARWMQIAVAASLAVGPALSVVDRALRTTGSSLAVLVPMLTGATVAFTTFAVGMQGIGEVISGIFNYEKLSDNQLSDFEVTLDGLAQSARDFADQLSDMRDEFTALRRGTQGVLFEGLDTQLKGFARNTLPTLTIGLAGSAEQFNRMGKDMLKTINLSARTGEMAAAFGAVQVSMEPLVPLPGRILNALTKLTIAAAPLLTRMNSAVDRWSKHMTERLNNAFDDGTLRASIDRAGETIVRFFRNIANNPEWKAFTSRLHEQGPQMAQIFANISEALLKILNALAPISGAIMHVVDAFARMIQAIPIEALTLIISKLVLFKAALLIGSFVVALTDKLILLRTAIVTLGNQAAMVAAIEGRLLALGLTAGVISKVATAMRMLGKAILGVALVATILWVFDKIRDKAKGAAPNVDDLTRSLKDLVTTGKSTGEFKKTFGDIEGFIDKLDELHKKQAERKKDEESGPFGFKIPLLDDAANAVSNWIEDVSAGKDSIDGLKDDFKSLDAALAKMVAEGNSKAAAAAFKQLSDAWVKDGRSLKDLKKEVPEYLKGLKDLKQAQKLAAQEMGRYGAQALKITTKLDAQKKATEGLRGSIEALNAAHRKAMGGEIAMEQAIDDLSKSLKENGKSLDIHTEKGRKNNTALLELAQTTSDAAMAKLEETGSWTEANLIYNRGRESLIAAYKEMGKTEEQAKKLADAILQVPEFREVDFKTDMESLVTEIDKAQKKVDSLKQKRKTAVGADKKELDEKIKAAQEELDGLKQRNKVSIEAYIDQLDGEVDKAQEKLDALKQKRKTAVGADKKELDDKIEKAQDKLDALKQKKAALILAKDMTGDAVASAQAALDSLKNKTLEITVKRNMVYQYKEGANIPGYGGNIPSRASGGMIKGPGSATSDSIMARVSNGEFVMQASAVKKYGAAFMEMLNNGMLPKVGAMPKFAKGGAVKGYAGGGSVSSGSGGAGGGKVWVETFKFLANTSDLDRKIRSSTSLLSKMASTAPKAVTIKATDGTKKATETAKANFKSVATTNQSSYKKVLTQTTAFKNSLNAQMNSLKGKNATLWKSVGTSLQTSIHNAYTKVQAATVKFSNGQVAAVTGIKNKSNAQWNSLGNSMTSRSSKTYTAISAGTKRFGNDMTRTFSSTRNSVGTAWNGVRPKLASPIKYLINSVINKGVVPAMNSVVKQLGGTSGLSRISAAGFASGGFVSGPGSATSDSIPARLSNGEFVMQASAVRKYGVGFMQALNNGQGPVRRASGGPVGRMTIGFARGGLAAVQRASKGKLEGMLGDYKAANFKTLADWVWDEAIIPLLEEAPGGPQMKNMQQSASKLLNKQSASYLMASIPDPNAGGGNVEGAKKWAKSQAGKPYQWGGAGNPSWDCSGFMGGVQKVIQGKNPKGRLFTTFNFRGSNAPAGWKRHLKSPFMVGVTNAGKGHMAGTLGGMNVESAGGVGVRVGASARGYNHPMFGSNWYGFKPAISSISNYKPGAGVAQWTGEVHQALREVGQSLSNTNRTLRRMNQESGGNPRTVNLWDANARRGTPSVGLMQVIKPTFEKYAGKHKGTGPKMYGVSVDPLANIYSSMRYALSRYGSLASAYDRPGGYALGGLVHGPGSGTSDSIPAMLSRGEFVIRSAAAKRLGVGYLNALNSGRIMGFKAGGTVSTTSSGTYYKIAKGDTLSDIAAKFKTTVSALMALNKNIKNANVIYAGQTILLKKIASNTSGSSGGSSSGTKAIPKAPKGDIQDANSLATLKNFVTLREAMSIASGMGFRQINEARQAIGPQENLDALLSGLTNFKSAIVDAFKGKTQDLLMERWQTTTKKLIPLQDRLDEVRKSLTTAQGSLDDLKGKFDNLKESVSGAIMDYGKITKIGTYGTSPTVLLGQLQKDVDKANQFQSLLEQLKSKGVAADLIGQVAEAGIAGGGIATANTILRMTPEQIAQLNALQAQLTTTANNAGSIAASGMYQAGIDAAQGMVDGLKSRESEIVSRMEELANALVTAVRQALGIKSPSKVMALLAGYTMDGYENEIVARTPGLAKVMGKAVHPDQATVANARPSLSTGTISSVAQGRAIHIENINVCVEGTFDLTNPAQRRSIAKSLAKEIKEEIRRDDRAHR